MGLFRKLALAICVLASPAAADTVADLRLELEALTSAVADLGRELSSGSASEQPGYDGSLLDRVDRMERALAELTGRTEELEYRIRRAIDMASNRLGDLEFRLTDLEGGDTAGLAPPNLGGTAPAGAAQPQLAAGEQRAFDEALTMAENGEADAAAAALAEFIETYPGSPLGAEASFRLADLHRDQGREPDAARAYLNLYMAAPEGPEAARALLALGESLERLEQPSEACAMFDELGARFPGSAQADTGAEARARLACP